MNPERVGFMRFSPQLLVLDNIYITESFLENDGMILRKIS